MRLNNNHQVMNLMNTNGRRSDVVNAYTIYMEILDELYRGSDSFFKAFPTSLNQYKFYKASIERSPEVFKEKKNYDWIQKKLEDITYKEPFINQKISALKDLPDGELFLKKLDNGIEDRARHYTSNLVKIGFVDKDRKITSVGKSFVEGVKLDRGDFEKLLPINDINLIFLRQLLKLRVYSYDYKTYYSPMMLCFYLLLHNEALSITDISVVISMINPSYRIDPFFLANDIKSSGSKSIEKAYFKKFDNERIYKVLDKEKVPMSEKIFSNHFKNRKSKKNIPTYYHFYCALVNFSMDKSKENLENLHKVYMSRKSSLDKAFSYGETALNFDKDNPFEVNKFLQANLENDLLKKENINKNIYMEFINSKRHDQVKEYSDTLIRLISVTGVVSLKNGIATLKYKELWEKLFNGYKLREHIFRETSKIEFTEYEMKSTSSFFENYQIEKILDINIETVNNTLEEITKELKLNNAEEVKSTLKTKTNDDFREYIEEKYSKEKITEILPMFSDRANDEKIKKMMESNASVPTLFEFIVGISWYHISNKEYDLFDSFNLTMNADFIPETHAGGGYGDIVAKYEDKVVMLEATLMNKQAQKRAEWEPVLRHATNLTISESNKKVYTLFIADELDINTINIWRAISSVPLKSSKEVEFKDILAENVTIMPIENLELNKFLVNDITENRILTAIESSYESNTEGFDIHWRNKILDNIFND